MARIPRTEHYNGVNPSPDWLSSSKLAHKLVEGTIPDKGAEIPTGPRKSKKIKLNGQTESQGTLAPEDALNQVLEVSGCDVEEIYKKVRGRGGNSVRVVAAWWMVTGAGLPNVEVARRLDMSNAGVSRAIRRVRSEPIRRPDSEIVSWATALEDQRDEQSNYSGPSIIVK